MAFLPSNRTSHATREIFFGFAICAALACAVITSGVTLQPLDASKELQLTSAAFKNGERIPSQYTCDGKNTSPPLAWTGTPTGTHSFALIMDDPDAPGGVWTHWVVFDLPADTSRLVEGATIPGSARQGLNDFRHSGYDGPCPPPGKVHHYRFKLYALDTMLGLKVGISQKEVEAAMANHILAQGILAGTYEHK